MHHPTLITGETFTDSRGTLSYANSFDLSPIKRMYTITHPDKNVIRAWQGHQRESKWFKCLHGSFVVAWKKIDDFRNPSPLPEPEYVILKNNEPAILFIPPGYANGLKALEDNSELLVFSNYYLGQSLDDKIRFDHKLWFDWSQF
ncbi:MAG: dTDP-4-dehydrorhamnose 3,5-epimerase family protein [Candidatus Delongbacteria bacterium]|jgi:dTDP-4-dehydrorhamnose 3,5-epimerase